MMFHTTVEPCAHKMQQLAQPRLKNKLAQFSDWSLLPYLKILWDQLIALLTSSPALLSLSAEESKTKTEYYYLDYLTIIYKLKQTSKLLILSILSYQYFLI